MEKAPRSFASEMCAPFGAGTTLFLTWLQPPATAGSTAGQQHYTPMFCERNMKRLLDSSPALS